MSRSFWRGYQPGVRIPVDYRPGFAMVTLWNDGSGFHPVTDIEWAMWNAFRCLDAIVADANRKFDAILSKSQQVMYV